MKSMFRPAYATMLAAVLAIALPFTAAAAVVQDTSSSTSDNAFATSIEANDLVRAGAPTLVSLTRTTNQLWATQGGENDGKSGTDTAVVAYYPSNYSGQVKLPVTLTFTLNLALWPEGYVIGEIHTFAGWKGGGTQTYANQKFTVEYQTVGSSTWTQLASVDYSPFTDTNSNTPANTMIKLRDSSGGLLVSRVQAIRFIYAPPSRDDAPGVINGTVIQEIDVLGTMVPPVSALKVNSTTENAYPVTNADLVNSGNTALVSLTRTTNQLWPTQGGENDGKSGTDTTVVAYYPSNYSGQVKLPVTLTFTLNVAATPKGYNIDVIEVFAGWKGGGTQTYANQKFTVEYQTVGSSAWTRLSSVDYSPFTDTNSNTPANTMVRLTRSMVSLASRVQAIRFTFAPPSLDDAPGVINGTVIQEIDVYGSPLL